VGDGSSIADIADFFGTISHDRLVALVAKRVADSKVLSLIRQILTAGVLRDGVYESTIAGTPQGGVSSPLLSNIYLHVFASRCSGRDSNLRATPTIGYACAGLARKRDGRWRAPVRC
jgi:retron-type reverse transcriptase